MKLNRKRWTGLALTMVLAAGFFSCTNELHRTAAPVELIVTNTQNLQVIDLQSGAVGCTGLITQVIFRNLVKDPLTTVDQRFNDVRITRYRVSYVRTDGGTLVPAPFVRSIDILVPVGGTVPGLGTFQLFQSDAVFQQPFVALLPQNGGRDPETGRTVVRMDVVMEFFGETLAGANVAGRTRVPLDFCFACGGCR